MRATVAVLILGFGSTSCIPKLSNLSKDATVPVSMVSYTSAAAEILVMPVWWEERGLGIHTPYVIPAAAIGTPGAKVPRRLGFYLDAFVCGGPSKFVAGFLVVTDDGTVVWNFFTEQAAAPATAALKIDLRRLLQGGGMGAELQELVNNDTIVLEMHADQDEVTPAERFLDKVLERE